MKAFLEAKQKLLQSDFLVHYDLKKPVILCCDASPAGVGACLSRVMADGAERPIAFASKTLSQEEGKYAQLEKGAPALIFGVRQFHKYLVGRQFTLVTDHHPLLRVLGPHVGVPTLAAARLQRLALILSAYDYEIQYKPGVENKEADLLSRLPIPVEVIDPNEQTFNVDYCEALPITAAEIAKETQRDRILRRVYQYTKCGWGPSGEPAIEQYRRRASELSIENGCLQWANRVIIPSKLRSLILSGLHGHLGMSRMKSLACSYVWWPSLDKETEEALKRCEACQSLRNNKPARDDPPHPWIYPQKPWERVHADFCEVAENSTFLWWIHSVNDLKYVS